MCVVNISKFGEYKNDLKNIIKELFEKKSEDRMLEVINLLEPIAKSNDSDRYVRLIEGLIDGADVLAEFFDGDDSVMVMTDDENIRKNRLNLLSVLTNQAKLIADFSLLVN